MLDLAALQQELKYFRQEVMTLQVMALRPGQSAAELRWLRQREREARAKVKRHVRAIEDYDHRLKSRYRQRAQQAHKANPVSRAAQLAALAARMIEKLKGRLSTW